MAPKPNISRGLPDVRGGEAGNRTALKASSSALVDSGHGSRVFGAYMCLACRWTHGRGHGKAGRLEIHEVTLEVLTRESGGKRHGSGRR